MAEVKAANLNDLTVDYNGVQFGGADSNYSFLPPEYSVQSRAVYDDAGRTVTHVEYTIQLKTTVYGTTEALLSTDMDVLRGKLLTEGKTLKIKGLGFGYSINPDDFIWGPKPISCTYSPVGAAIAWEIIWVIQFNVSECFVSNNPLKGAFLAFNYAVSWSYDFEGVGTRSTTGYVQIVQRRADYNNNNQVIADDVRPDLTCLVPPGYKRTNKTFAETADKTRLNFNIVDEEMPGEAPPPGISEASGGISFDSVGPGFAESQVTMNLTYKTARKYSRQDAPALMVRAFVTKQAQMAAKLGAGGVVIPKQLRFNHSYFDDSRVTSGSMTWTLTKCLNDMLNAAGLWEPVPGAENYGQWRASMEAVGAWANTGGRNIISSAEDDIIINVCNQTNSHTFGQVKQRAIPPDPPKRDAFRFSCPPISEENSWLGYEIQVRALRSEQVQTHTVSVQYEPTGGAETSTPISTGNENAKLEASSFDEQSLVFEYPGQPRNLVLLQFKGMRVKFPPNMPKLDSVAGLPVVLIEENIEPKNTPAFDLLDCPVWYLSGYRLYEVNGYIPDIDYVGKPNSCAKKDTNTASVTM